MAFSGLALACLLLASLLAVELGLRVAAPARHDPEHVRAELQRALARVIAAGTSSATPEHAGRGILHPYTGWQPEADPGGVFAWFVGGAHERELAVVVLGGETALAWSRDHGPALPVHRFTGSLTTGVRTQGD